MAASLKGAGDGGRDIMGKHEVVVVRAQEAMCTYNESRMRPIKSIPIMLFKWRPG
jgi:hypothetical protein